MNDRLNRVLDYLKNFDVQTHPVSFQSVPDGRVPTESFDYHIHKYWEVKFCSDPGELIIQAPQTVHCATRTDHVFAVTHNYVQLEEWFFDLSDDKNIYNFLPELLDNLSRVPLRSEFNTMRTHLVEAVVSNLIVIMTKLQWDAEVALKQRDLADRVLDYMQNHYFHSDLSVQDIARFAGISAQRLNILLRRKNNLGIRQNLIRIRLEHAAELLQDPAYIVKDAAALTGWKSAFYFGNSFRKHFGCAPGEYRKKFI